MFFQYVYSQCIVIRIMSGEHWRIFNGFVFMPTISEENVIVSESVLLYIPRISCSALFEMFNILQTGRCLVQSDRNKNFSFPSPRITAFLDDLRNHLIFSYEYTRLCFPLSSTTPYFLHLLSAIWAPFSNLQLNFYVTITISSKLFTIRINLRCRK